MENLWDRAEELLAAGKPFVLATIIRTRGSVPREVGAKMVVPPMDVQTVGRFAVFFDPQGGAFAILQPQMG